MSDFDFEEVFGDDYLHFYAGILTDELSDRQADLVAKLLELEPGQRVLDCPCGHGRIANRLAARGAEVVGVDITPHFLDVARQANAGVDYRLGDMRALDFDSEFDAVINVFTSFGYFDDVTDKDVLKRLRGALKPGGKLLIEHQAAPRMLTLVGGDHATKLDDDLLVDTTSLDVLSGRVLTERVSVRDGRVRRYHFSNRLFMPWEIAAWLREAGFDEVAVYDQEGKPFSLAARRMVVVAS